MYLCAVCLRDGDSVISQDTGKPGAYAVDGGGTGCLAGEREETGDNGHGVCYPVNADDSLLINSLSA